MALCYAFHNDSMLEYPDYPGIAQLPEGSYTFEPYIANFGKGCWGRVTSPTATSQLSKQWERCDVINVPTLYRTLALLLG